MKTFVPSRRVSMVDNGRRVRAMTFEQRSTLPSSAACLVASNTREALSALFSSPVALTLFEPVIPTRDAWSAILHEAALFAYRGTTADAAVVLRGADARTLARAAFGEYGDDASPLSPMERSVVDRIARTIGSSLAVVCGPREGAVVEPLDSTPAFSTFFELLIERPVQACVGIAVSREPHFEPRGAIGVTDLAEVQLTLDVAIDVGAIPAGEIAGLTPGTLLSLPPGGVRGRLRSGGRTLATGSCGVRHGWYALAVEGTYVAT